MVSKTAYIWGPISMFSAPLSASLLDAGWNVHVAFKSSLNLMSLSPLDLKSTAQVAIDQCLQTLVSDRERLRSLANNLKFVAPNEIDTDTKYDVVIFAGIAPNFDEPRVPRAPWAAKELKALVDKIRGTQLMVISSIFGGVQPTGFVPEEVEFARRKPKTSWEGVCQQYENKVLQSLAGCDSPWHLVRLPYLTNSFGKELHHHTSGLDHLFKILCDRAEQLKNNFQPGTPKLRLNFDPDCALSFLPIDSAVSFFMRYLEDSNRPRILNLVSTNALLNREWVGYLGNALDVEIVNTEKDDELNLPSVIKQSLHDNFQIASRNLYELVGRYNFPPVIVDENYFRRLITFNKDNLWTKTPKIELPKLNLKPEAPVSIIDPEKQIAEYFDSQLPDSLNTGTQLDKALSKGLSIGIFIKETSELGWILKIENGEHVVKRFYLEEENPAITFRFKRDAFMKIIQNKLSLNQAILTKQADFQGPMLPSVKTAARLDQFFRENPLL